MNSSNTINKNFRITLLHTIYAIEREREKNNVLVIDTMYLPCMMYSHNKFSLYYLAVIAGCLELLKAKLCELGLGAEPDILADKRKILSEANQRHQISKTLRLT